MKTAVTTRIIAGSAAAAAIAAPLLLGAGSASAATIEQNSHSTTVWLNHQETVQAAQSGLVTTLDQPAIKDHTSVYVREDSRYRSTLHSVNGRLYVHARKQQVIDEAAGKPNGEVGVQLSADPNNIVEIVQYWPSQGK